MVRKVVNKKCKIRYKLGILSLGWFCFELFFYFDLVVKGYLF